MTPEQLKKHLPNASPSFLKLNTSPSGLGGLEDPKRKQNPLQALAGSVPAQQRGKIQMARRFAVCIVSFRQHFLDSDNLQAGAKPLRDAIAESLGSNDSDKFIQWTYHQIISKPYGTVVILSYA